MLIMYLNLEYTNDLCECGLLDAWVETLHSIDVRCLIFKKHSQLYTIGTSMGAKRRLLSVKTKAVGLLLQIPITIYLP